MTDDELSSELDRRIDELALAQRERRRWLGPTMSAYVDALFAIGHARLGNPARALALIANARLEHDRIATWGHQFETWLLGALIGRFEQATARLPSDSALPESLEEQYTAMDPQTRAHVIRHRAALRMLDSVPYVLAAMPRRLVAGPFAELGDIEIAIDELARFGAGDRERVLVEALTALVGFAEADAMPLVARAVAQIRSVPPPRFAVRATALRVAACFGWGELVHEVLPALLDEIDAHAGRPDAFAALSTAVRALRRLGAADDLRRLIDRTARRIGGALSESSTHVALLEHRDAEDDQREDLRFVLAGAASTLGDRAAIELVQRATDLRITSPEANIVLHRRLCCAHAHAVPAQAVRKLRALADRFAQYASPTGAQAAIRLHLLDLIDAHVWAITMLGITYA